jgi:hypothetical protein
LQARPGGVILVIMKSLKRWWGGAGWGLVAVVLALGLAGCPQPKPKVGPDKPGKVETDPGRLMAAVKARSEGVSRMDARLEIDLAGVEGPFQGRLFGTMQLVRQDPQVSLSIQAYTLFGLPVMELVSIGERIEVYSPLQNTIYLNFRELAAGGKVEEMPLTAFGEAALPVDLVRDQIKLVYGLGFSDRYRYELKSDDDDYILSEWEGDNLRREIKYSLTSLDLKGVKVFRQGAVYGGLACSDHFASPREAGFIPSRMVINKEAMRLKFSLSNLRINGEAKDNKIVFRKPGDERLFLLTPPVP